MNYNFGTLQVEKVIIHDIPRHKAGEEGINPVLSEVESNLTQDLKNYFLYESKFNLSRFFHIGEEPVLINGLGYLFTFNYTRPFTIN